MKTLFTLVLVLMLFLLSGCGAALHGDIPKAAAHYGRYKQDASEAPVRHTVILTDEIPSAEKAKTVSIRAEAPVEESVFPQEADVGTSTDIVKTPTLSPPQGDTVYIEALAGSDEAILDEAFESERIAKSAFAFSFLPAFSLIFFPFLFIGLIGTLIQLSRFRKYEYVTEKGLDYERRAKRTLVLSIFIPLVIVALLIVLALALL